MVFIIIDLWFFVVYLSCLLLVLLMVWSCWLNGVWWMSCCLCFSWWWSGVYLRLCLNFEWMFEVSVVWCVGGLVWVGFCGFLFWCLLDWRWCGFCCVVCWDVVWSEVGLLLLCVVVVDWWSRFYLFYWFLVCSVGFCCWDEVVMCWLGIMFCCWWSWWLLCCWFLIRWCFWGGLLVLRLDLVLIWWLVCFFVVEV